LQDVRKTRDELLIANNSNYEDVEELMLDIREEMDEMNETNKRMNQILTIEQADEINDEELNEEFRRLELECERDQVQSGPEITKADATVTNMDPSVPKTTGPKNEEPASSETLPVPA
jgi:GTPase SAR1 family protein